MPWPRLRTTAHSARRRPGPGGGYEMHCQSSGAPDQTGSFLSGPHERVTATHSGADHRHLCAGADARCSYAADGTVGGNPQVH